MNESIEYTGKWWLPENPDKTYPGRLKFTPQDGTSLELDGFSSFFAGKSEFPIILGITSNGKYCTLYRSDAEGEVSNPEGFSITTIRASYLFVGAHFSDTDIRLTGLLVHYNYLDEWVDTSGFQFVNQGAREVAVKYVKPDSVLLFQSPDYSISIGFSRRGPRQLVNQKEVHIEQKAYMKINIPGEQPFTEYLAVSDHIAKLLSIAMTQAVYSLEIEA